MQFKMDHSNNGRRRRRSKGSNLRYIILLIALLVLFVWMLTFNLEPMVEMFLSESNPAVYPCHVESGESGMMEDVIYAPWKEEQGLLWIAHPSNILTGCHFRDKQESELLIRWPEGLPFYEGDLDAALQFSKMDEGAFRILEEAYCQVFDWTQEFGNLQVVSGLFACPDTLDLDLRDEQVFMAVFDANSTPARSVVLVWENNWSEKPLTEYVIGLNELNRLTGYGVFDDLMSRRQINEVESLPGILTLGYQFDHYQKRLNFFQEE